MVSAVLFYAGGYPAGIIFIAALVSFATVAVGLNNLSQGVATQSAAGKVDFVMPLVGVKEDLNSPPELEGIKLGVVLRSTAPFPMEIRIDYLETQISDRVAISAFYTRSLTVTRGIAVQFTNAIINVAGLERANQLLYGRISAKVTYGRPGKLRYPLERAWHMAFRFDKNGNLAGAEPSTTEFAKENGG